MTCIIMSITCNIPLQIDITIIMSVTSGTFNEIVGIEQSSYPRKDVLVF